MPFREGGVHAINLKSAAELGVMHTNMKDFTEKLGKPNIQICGLEIWVHGFQFPNAKGPFDHDWLNVNVHCSEKSANVLVSGNIICCSEIRSWSEQIALILYWLCYDNLENSTIEVQSC